MSTIQNNPAADRNPGIVPPWLSQPGPKNPGIVPPWLRTEPITILPIDEPEISLPVVGDTQFVSEPVDVPPTSLADALRSR